MWTLKTEVGNENQLSLHHVVLQEELHNAVLNKTHTYTYMHAGTADQLQVSNLCRLTGSGTLEDPKLGLMLCAAILKFLIISEQNILHFHFALRPENYVASPTYMHVNNTHTHTHAICMHMSGGGGVSTLLIPKGENCSCLLVYTR